MAIRILMAVLTLSGFGICEPEHCEDAGVLRLTPTTSIASPDGNVGRLEVCLSSTWGTFTLDSNLQFWSEKNIQVACRQLGFSGGLNSIPPSHIPFVDKSPANLSVHYGTVACSGEESRVNNCGSNRVTDMRDPNPIAHLQDVFLVCQPKLVAYSDLHVAGEQVGDVRLFGHINSGVGAVEILTEQLGWAGICPDGWDNTDARVVCQSLGYDFGTVQSFSVAGSSVNRSVGDAVCQNTPGSVSSSRVQAKLCSFQEVVQPDHCTASSGIYAGVICGTSRSSVQDPVRMFGRGLFDSKRAVGVVEVFLDNRWGVVCENQPEELARVNARVLCRKFFNDDRNTRPLQIPMASLRTYESHQKPLWANSFICPTTSLDFNDCLLEEPLGFANCSTQHVLAVDCGPTNVKRENNETAIIVGVGVTVFLFAVVLFCFGTVMYNIFGKKRRSAAISTGTFALTAGDLGHADPADVSNGGVAAAVNVSYSYEDDEVKVADTVKETNSSTNNADHYQKDEKLTKA